LPISERSRPQDVPSADVSRAWQAHLAAARARAAEGLDPALVSERVVDAIRSDRFYILTHPERSTAAVLARQRWPAGGIPPEF
jgi:hypothetical protein